MPRRGEVPEPVETVLLVGPPVASTKGLELVQVQSGQTYLLLDDGGLRARITLGAALF